MKRETKITSNDVARAVEEYTHHGARVFVFSDLKGKHRDNCLCFSCERFHPGEEQNCHIAQELYDFCVRHGTVTPVYECPKFKVSPAGDTGDDARNATWFIAHD